jgi:3-phenylpropionate/trans-cinnamate dioxygenase ferredoxin reductase subunit
VTAIDPAARRVTLARGRSAARVRPAAADDRRSSRVRLTVDGAELDGVYYLRTLADCDALRERLADGRSSGGRGRGLDRERVRRVGASAGLEVTVVDPLALPNERIFGPEIGAFYRDVHVQHGVEMVLGDGVARRSSARPRSRRCEPAAGREITCDFVVVGIGVHASRPAR